MSIIPAKHSAKEEQRKQEAIDKITRIVALIFAACTTFFFFFKLLFL